MPGTGSSSRVRFQPSRQDPRCAMSAYSITSEAFKEECSSLHKAGLTRSHPRKVLNDWDPETATVAGRRVHAQTNPSIWTTARALKISGRPCCGEFSGLKLNRVARRKPRSLRKTPLTVAKHTRSCLRAGLLRPPPTPHALLS